MVKFAHLLFAFAFVLVILCYFHPLTPQKSEPVFLNFEEMSEAPPQIYQELVQINRKNGDVQSVSYPNICIQTEGIRIGAELNAALLYEKNLRFRLNIYSVFGKESDIGSNDDIFWFWSKRMSPPALFYAKHEDIYKTRLKTAFHPFWLKDILGINPIDLNDAKILKQDDFYVVVQSRLGVMGEPVVRIYLVDPKQGAILGHYIYASDGNLIASAEVLEFYNIDGNCLPKTISINYAEEDLKSTWIMGSPKINLSIDPANWQPEDYKQKINLDGYVPKSYQAF